MINNYAKNRLSLFMGGSTTGSVGQILIGTGSSSVTATNTNLVTPSDRQTVTQISYSPQKITWQFDWNSSEISGLTLTEFGLIQSGTGLTGSLWSRNVIPGIEFDGTNELRIEIVGEVF